jgi:hypothetical protein
LSVEFLEYQKKIAGHIVERNSRQKAIGNRKAFGLAISDLRLSAYNSLSRWERLG